MITAPHAAPMALPRAPDRLAPPITQAAIACSSKPVPAVGMPGAEPGRQQHAADAGEQPGDCVHRGGDQRDRHAGQPGCFRIRAHRVHVAPKYGAAEHEPGDRGDREENDE